jgi:hypothetical protein
MLLGESFTTGDAAMKIGSSNNCAGVMLAVAGLLGLNATMGSHRCLAAPIAEAGGAIAAAPAALPGVVSCATFASSLRRGTDPFRSLMQQSSGVFQGANSQSIRFLAVQPSPAATAAAYPTVVFFEGTSEITPDWPAQLLVGTGSALCNHAALLFFDYPGIGGTAYPGDASFTFDAVSETVYNLLAYLKTRGAVDVTVVDPAGWSLGTAAARKFGAAAGHNQAFKASGMSLGTFLLISANSGGDLHSAAPVTPLPCGAALGGPNGAAGATDAAIDRLPVDAGAADAAAAALGEAASGHAANTNYYPATGAQAMCATSVLDQLLVETNPTVATELKSEFFRLTYPYVDLSPAGQQQSPYGAGDPPTICAATITNAGIEATCNLQTGQAIESQCAASSTSTCSTTLAAQEANREQAPYLGGVGADDFLGERQMSLGYAYAACGSASASAWQSTNCVFNANQTGNPIYIPQLAADGSPCQTQVTGSANAAPTIVACPGLTSALRGKGARFYVWNGQEDLLIRPDYGKALCTWLNGHGFPCTFNSLPNAGHGVMFTDASTLFHQLAAAVAASAGASPAVDAP